MTVNTLHQNNYVEALFEAALETGNLESISKEIKLLTTLIPGNFNNTKMLQRVDSIPGMAPDLAKKLIGLLDPDPLISKLIEILADRKYLHRLPDLLVRIQEKIQKHNGIMSSTVTSARVLSQNMQEELVKRLEKMVQGKVDVNWKIDRELIGGFVINIGFQVFDSSLKNRIERLRNYLLISQRE